MPRSDFREWMVLPQPPLSGGRLLLPPVPCSRSIHWHRAEASASGAWRPPTSTVWETGVSGFLSSVAPWLEAGFGDKKACVWGAGVWMGTGSLFTCSALFLPQKAGVDGVGGWGGFSFTSPSMAGASRITSSFPTQTAANKDALYRWSTWWETATSTREHKLGSISKIVKQLRSITLSPKWNDLNWLSTKFALPDHIFTAPGP